jgi:hypothetical protein
MNTLLNQRRAGAAAAALAVFSLGSSFAASPGTLCDAIGLDGAVFAHALEQIEDRRAGWLAKAAEAVPPLFTTTNHPVAVVRMERDAAAFQGWKPVPTVAVEEVCNRPLKPGESFILDFGEHQVGHFIFSMRRFDIPVDAPVRLSFVFGETPAEVAEPLDPYEGSLPRSWMQDETVNIDEVPQTVRLPRRYAFRYVKVTVVACSTYGTAGFTGFRAEAVTSADENKLLPFVPRSAADAALDRVARRTLRDCMQTVFEDGPKRDRRLWLGDLRLQALVNYATYRNFDLVKRSLCLLAGTATDKGLVATCVFERPGPARGGNSILDYTALFASTVLEYLQAGGDVETAQDLWPLVLNQLKFTLGTVDSEGLFTAPPGWWLFIDWNRNLDKQVAEQGVILRGLQDTLKLAEMLGRSSDVPFAASAISRMTDAAREKLWDESRGLFVSGPDRQVSWASQAWMVLAGVPTREQAQRALRNAMGDPAAQKPVAPYMVHYVVEALLASGMKDEADSLLHDYWGGMIRQGADTFREVCVPEDDFASPYRNHLMNSYCHAWSCTPSWFLRVLLPAEPPAGKNSK